MLGLVTVLSQYLFLDNILLEDMFGLHSKGQSLMSCSILPSFLSTSFFLSADTQVMVNTLDIRLYIPGR